MLALRLVDLWQLQSQLLLSLEVLVCREVEKLAGLHGIFLRTGCFCNPGACARHLGITASQSKRNFEAGHVCWDDNDIIDGRWGCSPVCLQCLPMAVSMKDNLGL